MSHPIITKKYHFCASHKYGNNHWSEEKNYEVFRKDYNTHGHNYILEVSMTGPVNPDTGWLVDLGHVNKIVKSNVVDIIDHSQIEKIIDQVIEKNPKMVQEYLAGKDKLLGFFVGLAMKESKGKANPKILNDILKNKLNKEN